MFLHIHAYFCYSCAFTQQAATSANGNVIIAEVDINKVPSACRNVLTRSSTHEEVDIHTPLASKSLKAHCMLIGQKTVSVDGISL
jgi:hypothetical protein